MANRSRPAQNKEGFLQRHGQGDPKCDFGNFCSKFEWFHMVFCEIFPGALRAPETFIFLSFPRFCTSKPKTFPARFARRERFFKKVSLINDKHTWPSSIKTISGSKNFPGSKNFFNQRNESFSPTHRKIQTLFRHRGSRTTTR